MYKVFNMGHRMELYVDPAIARNIIEFQNHLVLMLKLLEE